MSAGRTSGAGSGVGTSAGVSSTEGASADAASSVVRHIDGRGRVCRGLGPTGLEHVAAHGSGVPRVAGCARSPSAPTAEQQRE